MRSLFIVAFFTLSACRMTVQEFDQRGLDLLCERTKECDDGFEDLICVEDDSDPSDNTIPTDNGCIFDSKAAKKCLKAIKEASCDDYLLVPGEEQCTKVYFCPPASTIYTTTT